MAPNDSYRVSLLLNHYPQGTTPSDFYNARLEPHQVLWLGSLLPRLLTTPNGSQWLPTAPCDYKHTLLLASNDSH